MGKCLSIMAILATMIALSSHSWAQSSSSGNENSGAGTSGHHHHHRDGGGSQDSK